ncbi:MAG TPA: FtsX-like permease family protein [Pyrinomonadaceae bacterium]|jgi:ABC-type lipoprotein release transport system permease subunit
MQTHVLLKRNLKYFWRTNLAVIFGVGIAVAVLVGALLVGDSVRASLRELFLLRLGKADHVVSSTTFFRERLAEEIQAHQEFKTGGLSGACPLIMLEAAVTHEESRRTGTGVVVYGVDQRFWEFHQRAGRAPEGHEVLLSESLSHELGAKAGDTLLLRIEKPSAIPVESLHGRRDDLGRTLRLKAGEALPAASMGEFSVRLQQTEVRALFVPLRLLQKELDQEGKANTLLVSEKSAGGKVGQSADQAGNPLLRKILKESITLEDLGVRLRALEAEGSLVLESESGLLNDSLAETAQAAAARLSLRPSPVFSYLANSLRSGSREIPYSIMTAIGSEDFERLRRGETRAKTFEGRRKTNKKAEQEAGGMKDGETAQPLTAQQSVSAPASPVAADASGPQPLILNEWAARELGVQTGAHVSVEYYLWQEDGRLLTKTAEFQLAGIVPIEGLAADRNLVPDYPGITGTESLSDWDPPFPVDLSRIRPRDEAYWDQYRTTPKAFIQLASGQQLWQTRFGKLTSIRFTPVNNSELAETLAAYRRDLREAIDPAQAGLKFYPARVLGLEASRGATDFGEYFLYFSFFLVASALLLAALFFKLGIEQRLREIGVLQAIGFPAAKIRALFLIEGSALAFTGTLLGLAGALAYGSLMMKGLRTWWLGAVGTTMLSLHVSPASLLLGSAGGLVATLLCIVWTLRRLNAVSTRSLLAGSLVRSSENGAHKKLFKGKEHGRLSFGALAHLFSAARVGVVFGLAGITLLLFASLKWVGAAGGFFGGGILLLMMMLCWQSVWLRRGGRRLIGGQGWWPLARLGFRNATHRPGRSVLCISLMASAAFIIVSVDAFKRHDEAVLTDKKSGSGGYPLLAESLLPLVQNPNTAEGLEALSLSEAVEVGQLPRTTFARFRVRPGDDASCLNLYQPRHPKILAPTDDFLQSGRFAFQDSLAWTEEEKQNPWLLLKREMTDGAIPVIADANSMTYVLHLKLGDEFLLEQGGGQSPLRLRLVAALSDSIFQSELLMSEKNFLRLFPEQEGYRFFLLETQTPESANATAAVLEERLSDFGFDVMPTGERLANFHRVENTFISTFQMLGGLGLVLGTLGLGAILLRNVLERRRELALLRAVGYSPIHFSMMVMAENAFLLCCGLLTGTLCALLAIGPVIFSRGGHLPTLSLALLLLAVVASGLISSLLATAAALSSPLLNALRSE